MHPVVYYALRASLYIVEVSWFRVWGSIPSLFTAHCGTLEAGGTNGSEKSPVARSEFLFVWWGRWLKSDLRAR